MFDYDSNYIDINTQVKNLKYTAVEITERVYVDMPMRKQKEVPIERKQDVAMTLKETGVLGKVNFNKDLYNAPKPQIQQQPIKQLETRRQSFVMN